MAKADAMVAQLSAVTTKYPVPTTPVSGVSALKGKTVYYVPLVAAIPGFAATAVAMKASLAKAGLKLQVCDGQGNPSAIAACVGQATGAGAAGIILDAAPYGMAENALNGAKAKGIPIIIADQYPPTTSTVNTDAVTYVPGVVDQPSQIAWWTIADSKGARERDHRPGSGLALVEAVRDQLAGDLQPVLPRLQDHPQDDHRVHQLAARVGHQREHPGQPERDVLLHGVRGQPPADHPGHSAVGRTNISLSVAGGSTDGLGLLKSGSSVVKAVVTVDEAYAAWALTDEILRMATKSPPVAETYVSRLFTTQNIGTIQVTPAAENSGAWFGDTSYQSEFAQLWGV